MHELNTALKIEELIYEIRGMQVMMDKDVAFLFGYETKYLNRQVQRNKERFPENYCFQLTEVEYENLRCQNVTSSSNNYGGRRYMPYVFTEHGITMLAGILRSDVAVSMSLKIVNAFVTMRRFIVNNQYHERLNNIETKVILHDAKFDEIFAKLENEKNNHLFFEGQIYDAYSLLIDILNKAQESIIIIDNYIDKKLLDVLAKVNKHIEIITSHMNKNDVEKYNQQYNNIHIKIYGAFHDRFIILDKKTFYHCGASFKDLGKKCFAITKFEDKKYLQLLLETISML